jgi:hypothetical protein
MNHSSRQPMSPTTASVTILTAENEALRRRVAQLEAELAAERGTPGKPLLFESRRKK